jgi:hypothetical protein
MEAATRIHTPNETLEAAAVAVERGDHEGVSGVEEGVARLQLGAERVLAGLLVREDLPAPGGGEGSRATPSETSHPEATNASTVGAAAMRACHVRTMPCSAPAGCLLGDVPVVDDGVGLPASQSWPGCPQQKNLHESL